MAGGVAQAGLFGSQGHVCNTREGLEILLASSIFCPAA
jgi:hypothetical protein